MSVSGGVVLRTSLEAVVSSRCDDKRARAEGEEDGVVEQRVVVLTSEAQVDHPWPSAGRFDDALDRRALVEDAERARVPDAQYGLGVDADDPDAVVGGRHDRADLGAVVLVLVAEGLRVEDGRVRAAGELGMAHVDARVDDGHGLSRAGGVHTVGPDGAAPPLLGNERVGRGLEPPRGREHAVRPAQLDDAGPAQL